MTFPEPITVAREMDYADVLACANLPWKPIGPTLPNPPGGEWERGDAPQRGVWVLLSGQKTEGTSVPLRPTWASTLGSGLRSKDPGA